MRNYEAKNGKSDQIHQKTTEKEALQPKWGKTNQIYL